jgi:hypothetical protein
MKTLLDLSPQQLRRAAQIKEQIASLEKQMQALLNQGAAPAKKSGGLSPAARAKISAALKARWAKIKAAKNNPSTAKAVVKSTARKTMSAAQRAKIAATLKARWAKIKAAKAQAKK